MNRFPLSLLAALSVCFLSHGVAWGQPAISRAVPAAIPPGQTTLVTLYGAKLEGVGQVWTSFPAQVEVQPGGSAAQVACKITLPADVPLGIGGLIVGSPTGASGVLLLAVDDLPSVVDNGKNHDQSQAQPLDWPVAVDGLTDGSQADLYRVEGRAGQRLAVEVYAGRLDSTADPVIRLLNAQGNELRMSDDEPGLGADGRFEFTFPADGAYFLQVHDNKYQAGGFYRLRVGDFPLINTPYPLGARRGSTVRFGFAKATPAETEPALVHVPEDAAGDWGLAARYPGGASSAIARLVLSDVPECVEREPNDQSGSASSLVIPAAANGRLETEGDVDVYAFHATAGRPLDVQATAARRGSPAVPLLAIKSADGKTLVESAFGEVADPQIRFAPPADGTYYLEVQELLGRGGPEYSYRVAMTSAPPFQLALKNDKNSVLTFLLAEGNGAIALPVECTRNGYDGPIELSLEDPSTGLRLYNTTIPAKATAAQPLLVVPDSFQPGDLHVVRLVGTAILDGIARRSTVSTAAVLRAKQPRMLYAPEWLDGRLALATKAGPAAAPFTVAVEPATILVPRNTGTADCLLRVERTDKEFKEALRIFAGHLPEGVSAEVKKEEKEGEEAWRVTIKAAPTVPVSLNPIRLTAYGAFKGTGFAIDQQVPLKIFDPLSLQVELPGPLAAGTKQSVTVRVAREGGDPQPVTLRVEGLPADVTAPAELTVPADQDQATIELAAGEGAAAGTHPLVIHAITTYQGQQLEVKSSARELRIAKP